MRHSISMLVHLLSIQIRSQTKYRISFLFEVGSSIFFYSFYYVAFVLALQRFEDLGGWTLGEVSLIIGMVEFSFGLMDMLFSGFDPDYFAPQIRIGSFDQMLLRPVNITFQVLGSRLDIQKLGRVIMGVIIFSIGLSRSGAEWTAAKAFYLPFIVVGQVLAFAAFFIVGSTITFWTVERIEAINIFTYGGSEFASYPATIYPNWLRRFFTYVIPFVFISYYPALYLLDKDDPFNLPGFAPFLGPFVGAGLFTAALAFWRFGVRHYHSTGS